jgi:bacteriocin-like protein
MGNIELIELTEEQLSKIIGGGVWVYSNGQWIYYDDEDV